MLKRIYIHNFRCLENFELDVGNINLFMGVNGSGKSSVFHVLRKIQKLVTGNGKVTSLFNPEDLTIWQKSLTHTFALEIAGNGGRYKYELAIEHEETKQKARVAYEKLWFNDNPLLKFESGNAQLYHDDHTKGPKYPFDWNQSAVATLPARPDNTYITWFRERLGRFIIVQIDPTSMAEDSIAEETSVDYRMQNFVSWYRHIYQNQGKAIEITESLREVLPGFEYFEFVKTGELQRILRLFFSSENGEYFYRFSQLSDGQRMLIALYTLLYYAQFEDYTICIDEPQNYVSLPEIQPWLMLVEQFCDAGTLQTLLISHHPELIDYFGASAGCWFYRQVHTPTRVRRLVADESGLPPSELVASGWLHE